MKILELHRYDVLNGPGIRTSIWTSGCVNKCPGCWSPHTWDPNQGKEYLDYREEILKNISNPKIDGISILGGDPLYNVFYGTIADYTDFVDLITMCNWKQKSVWLWTGYTFENIQKHHPEILERLNILIDGPFIESKKDLTLPFRGSSNQRIIDVQESLKNNKIITLY